MIENLNLTDAEGRTPLMMAAANGDYPTLVALIRSGADVTARDGRGGTALIYAVHGKHITVAKSLLAAGADLNARDKLGWTALRHAAYAGSPHLVQFLTSRGADPNVVDFMDKTPLMYAASEGHVEACKELLSARATLEYRNRLGKSALIYAAEGGHSSVAQVLLEAGADPNMRDKMGLSSLRYAARRGSEETVDVLLRKGADINARDTSGKTALMGAVRQGHTRVVERLIKADADLNLKTLIGRTALMFAAYEGRLRETELLIEAGADLNLQDEIGWTALMYGVFANRVNITKFLIDHRALATQKDTFGRTVLSLAKTRGYEEILKTLSAIPGTQVEPFLSTRKPSEPLALQFNLGKNHGRDSSRAAHLEAKSENFCRSIEKPPKTFYQAPVVRSTSQKSGSCIAVLTYNRRPILDIALEGIIKHCPQPLVIFEDGGFKDDTRKILSVGKCSPCLDLEADYYEGPNFRAFLGTSNLGVAGNTNRALKWFLESDYDHLLLCNDDMKVFGDFPSFYAKAHQDLGIGLFCFCDYKYPGYEPKVVLHKNYTLNFISRPLGLMLSITREVVEKVGFFDVRYGKYGQEHVGFTYRVGLAGFMNVNGETPSSIDVKSDMPLLTHQLVPSAIQGEELSDAYLLALMHGIKTENRCKLEGFYQPFRLRTGIHKNKYIVPFSFWDQLENFRI